MVTAQKFISDDNYDQALPILLARTVRNREHSTFEALIRLAERQLIPKKYLRKVAAVFQAGNKMLMDPHKQTIIGNMFASGYFGENYRNVSLQIWRNCADKDMEAKVNLGIALLELSDATKTEINEGVTALLQSGKRKNVQAVVKLAEYYDHINDNLHAFQWYWVARWLKEPSAQAGLERIVTRINKQDFATFKINAEALVEEIDWNSKNNIL